MFLYKNAREHEKAARLQRLSSPGPLGNQGGLVDALDLLRHHNGTREQVALALGQGQLDQFLDEDSSMVGAMETQFLIPKNNKFKRNKVFNC